MWLLCLLVFGVATAATSPAPALAAPLAEAGVRGLIIPALSFYRGTVPKIVGGTGQLRFSGAGSATLAHRAPHF